MQSRLIPDFLWEVENFYATSIKRSGTLDTAQLLQMFSKYEKFEYYNIPKVITFVPGEVPIVYFVLFYHHVKGFIFQVSGLFAPNANKPIYSCTKIPYQNEEVILVQNMTKQREVPEYIEDE